MDVGAVPRGTWWPREYYVVSAVALWGGGIAAVVALLSSEGDRARAVPLDRAPRRFAIIPAPGVRSVASGRFRAAAGSPNDLASARTPRQISLRLGAGRVVRAAYLGRSQRRQQPEVMERGPSLLLIVIVRS